MKTKDYDEWYNRYIKELKIFTSDEAMQIHLCLVAQGYRELVIRRGAAVLGSPFIVFPYIKKLEEIINEKTTK